MFQRLADDLKDSTGTALRLTSLAAAAASDVSRKAVPEDSFKSSIIRPSI